MILLFVRVSERMVDIIDDTAMVVVNVEEEPQILGCTTPGTKYAMCNDHVMYGTFQMPSHSGNVQKLFVNLTYEGGYWGPDYPSKFKCAICHMAGQVIEHGETNEKSLTEPVYGTFWEEFTFPSGTPHLEADGQYYLAVWANTDGWEICALMYENTGGINVMGTPRQYGQSWPVDFQIDPFYDDALASIYVTYIPD